MFKPAQLIPYFKNISPAKIWLGYSGGLDSHVLLHALVELINKHQINLTLTQLNAVYINHGWSAHANAWAEHCRKICAQLNIHFQAITIDAKTPDGASPEAYARAARYNAFAKLISTHDYLVTAHQEDDQAETFLIQLLRGAGVKGLSSMPALSRFARGWHLRPLLSIARADLLAYAKQQSLNWIEDDSNRDPRFARNFLRHTIAPLLKQRWPGANTTIARAAAHCAETSRLLDELAQIDFMTIKGRQINTVSCAALLQLSAARRKNALRYWFTQRNVPLPSSMQLQHILHDVLESKPDACPQIAWGNKALRRYQDYLYMIDYPDPHNPHVSYTWDLIKPLTVPHVGALKAELSVGAGICAASLQRDKLSIRFRQQGERCHPAGRKGSHPLKKLMQEWRIPPWERARIPLLYCGEQLAAVIGHCVCEGFTAAKNKQGWVVYLEQTHICS